MSGTGRTVALCVLAYVAARAVLVLSLADVFGYGEELAKGAAAKAMLDGLGVAHHRLAYVYHEGGGFVVTHLKALLFLALGPSVLAHKVLALCTSSLVLAAALLFTAEHVDRRAVVPFAAAFTLAPGPMQRASLLSLGTHFEAMLLVLLILSLGIRIAGGAGAVRPRDAWGLGLCSGFGIYVSAVCAPAVLAVGLAAVARRRLARRDALRAACGFALGALPLWTMLALVGTDALVPRAEVGFGRERASLVTSLGALVGPILLTPDPLVWVAAAGALALAAVGLARRPRTTRAVVLGYLALHAAAYVASGLAVRFDHEAAGAWLLQVRLVPFWLLAAAFAAGGAVEAWRRGGAARLAGAAAFAALCAPGARAGVALVRDGRPGRPLENLELLASLRGYSYREYFGGFRLHLEGEPEDRAAVMLRFDDDPELLVPAVAERLFLERWMRTPNQVGTLARDAFGERAPLALLGLGQALHGSWGHDFEVAFERLRWQPPEAQAPLAEALGRNGLRLRPGPDDLDPLLAIPVPDAWRAPFLRGVGWRAHQAFRLRPDLARRWLDAQAPALRPELAAGYERARVLDLLD